MRAIAAIVEASVDDQHSRRLRIVKVASELKEVERSASEKKADLDGARDKQRKLRVELGKLLLIEKEEVGHGNWIPHLAAVLKIPRRSASRAIKEASKQMGQDVKLAHLRTTKPRQPTKVGVNAAACSEGQASQAIKAIVTTCIDRFSESERARLRMTLQMLVERFPE